MGLNKLLFPERLLGQIIYAGDRHCEIFALANKRIIQRKRIAGVALAELDTGRWPEIGAQLQAVDTGIILNSDPFIYNFFEFDKLPWSRKLLLELVAWKLQKIFPENIEAYDHQFFCLNKKRIFSILIKKTFLEQIESLFRGKNTPLIYIGNSTLEILNRLVKLKHRPDFFVEIDDCSCSLVFQNKGLPIYIRKFKIESRLDMAAEISKTVQFVKNNYGCDPRSFCFIDHQEEGSAERIAAELARENLSCQSAALEGKTPYIPGSS
ncbi:MAG: hypothetical protein WCL37_07485 [Chrysiogenales bacterium]